MRVERRRTKKLTVAFHFLFANQAGWRCDECRQKGLEKKRRCARQPVTDKPRTVWVRNGVAASSCPKSIITGESLAFIEEYQARRTFGDFGQLKEISAKTVDAFSVLEQLIAKERSNER